METNKEIQNHFIDPSSPEARAFRLRRLRNLANLSRKDVCERSNIKPDTLVGWEVSRHGGLTKNGAIKIIDCISKEGVQCSLEWLLYGINKEPTIIPTFKDRSNQISKKTPLITDEDEQIVSELLFFKKSYNDTIDYIISDNSMNPHYHIGDYIAGIKRYQKINALINHDCIIQTTNGFILFRKLLAGSENNKFNLIANNLSSKTEHLILQDVSINYAAPIIWHRRKNTC